MTGAVHMNLIVARLLLCLVAAFAFLGTAALSWAQSTDGTYRSTGLGPYPPNLGYGAAGPMMMLTASKDHTLFSPIYTDYEDIDGDREDDTTFKPTFRYYGYFDAAKCYTYSAGWSGNRGRFEPALVVTAEANTGRLACPRGQGYWSGNFLNWVTMTRLDVVRKTLYGGFRREDTTTDTTLEMALLSQDAHSFVKYYSGTDVADYTPFDFTTDLQGAGITICNRSGSYTRDEAEFPMMRVVRGNYSLWATTPGTVCNWREDQRGFAFGEKVRAFYAKYGPSQGQAPDPTAHRTELPGKDADGLRASSARPDFAVRVQACKPGMTDGESCQAYVSTNSSGIAVANYKPIGLLQEFGSTPVADRASRAEFGLITGSFDSNLKGGALRKNIGSVNDEVDPSTGRFCHNITSGQPAQCAQSNGPGIVKTFDRIQLFDAGNYNNTARDRTAFVSPREVTNGEFASWGNPMSEMVVQALAYFAGRPTFDQPSNMGRDALLSLPINVSPIDPLSNASPAAASTRTRGALYGKGICRPMYVLAMSSGSVSFDSLGSSDGDVYNSANYFINANGQPQSLTQLTDTIGDAARENVNGTRRSVGSAANDFGFDCTAKLIGTGSLIGEVYSSGLSSVVGVCPEAPGVKGSYLGAGAAFMANTHAIRKLGSSTPTEIETAAGLTADTGADVLQERLPPSALRVKTYAASLAGGVARIEIPIGDTGKKVFITPESTWDHGRDILNLMPGAMLTFRALRAGATAGSGNPSGAYLVTWNDAQFGGDYDMDMVGFIRWELAPVAGQAGEYDLTVLTDVLGHEAGAKGSHGFSIIGTEAPPNKAYGGDGSHLTHGSNSYFKTGRCSELARDSRDYRLTCAFTDSGTPLFDGSGAKTGDDRFAWPTSVNGVAGSVGFIDQVGSGAVTSSTTVSTRFRVKNGADAVTLRDPLWYMAKYGSFDTGERLAFAARSSKSPEKAAVAGAATNWDSENNSDPLCASGARCADGEPDGYFLARRPEQLELRLRQLLERISKANSTAPALSSTQLLAGSLKYVTEFDPGSFSGNVKAFALLPTGDFATTPASQGGERLKASPSRQIITNDGFTGLPFQWATTGLSIATTPGYVQALLGITTSSTATLSAQQSQLGSALVAYMRGETASEGAIFRRRGLDSIMGPVVNSSPWVQDTQVAARYTDADFPAGAPSYRSFAVSKANRASVLWVGANDGMLHGFRASDLSPVMSYVPSPLAARLASAMSVTNTTAVPLMDGSPFTADVLVPTATAGVTTATTGATAAAASAWRTYLFAPLGRGGRAVFALDVTGAAGLSATGADSEVLNEARAGSIFKWVFTASDDADLGHGLLNPVRHNVSGQASQVVYLNSGKFGLLVPNGYNASTGRAALFILNAEGPGAGATSWKDSSNQPRGYVKLVPQATDTANGLMGATWVDLDNNGTADVVYATDLKGQVWKFDLRSSNPSEWRSALLSGGAAVPLFTASVTTTATVGLPITTAPAVSFPSFGGTMISFGTGRSIEASDFPDTSVTQRFFTVWDKGRYAEDVIFPAATESAVVLRPRLNTFLKRLLRRSSDGFVYQIRTNASGEALDAQGNVVTSRDQEVPLLDNANAVGFDPAVNDGWFFEFPEAGEAVLSSPVSRQNFLLFTSVRPLSGVTADQSCSAAPLGTVYGFNPVNGLPVPGLLRTYVIRDSAGNVVSTVNAVGNDLGTDQGGTVARDGTFLRKRVCDSNGENCRFEDQPRCGAGKIASRFATVNADVNGCVPANDLRIQWREIPGMKTR